jgi:hypothetical protein
MGHKTTLWDVKRLLWVIKRLLWDIKTTLWVNNDFYRELSTFCKTTVDKMCRFYFFL